MPIPSGAKSLGFYVLGLAVGTAIWNGTAYINHRGQDLHYEHCQEDEVLVADQRFDGPNDADYRCVNAEQFVTAELADDTPTPTEERLASEFAKVLTPRCLDLGTLVVEQTDGVVTDVRITVEFDNRRPANDQHC